jgi:class 3 adenylate cyclase/DNA-binding SARP family transcriptional activator
MGSAIGTANIAVAIAVIAAMSLGADRGHGGPPVGGVDDAGEDRWGRSKGCQRQLNAGLSGLKLGGRRPGPVGVSTVYWGRARARIEESLEFRILGSLEVVAAGETVLLGSAQQRAVLALLLIHAPEPVSLGRLIDELWGERPPATAEHAVQVYVSAIRKILRAGGNEAAVRSTAAGYVLDTDPEKVDAKRFERLVREARGVLPEDPSQAREFFEQALSLWRGPTLGELSQFEFAAREADRLEELHATAVEGVVEARLELGEHADVIGQITALVGANPLRENPRRQLMLALYRSGRHAEALAAYRDARAALDEIGLEPTPELRQLEEAILRHDPTIAAQPRVDLAAEATSPAEDALTTVDGGVAAPQPKTVVEGTDDRRRSPAARRRKVVTALFCDVTGSTALGEELDPEALVEVMNRYFAELRAVIERHGGTVAKFIGDAVMAVFGIPQVREDDALRAVRAAAEIRDRLPAIAEEVGVALSFRTGVNTGLVLVGEGENLAIGDAVNVAARLEQAAAPGEILLGADTLRLVRDAVEVESLEPLAVKGKSEAVRLFRLVAVDLLAPGLKRHLEGPLVGRERELGLLRTGWDRAVVERGCHLFNLLGTAGVGKSRLVSELVTSLGDAATALTGRCLHYGEGITFWPLIEALTPVGEPARTVLEHLGSGGAATPEELFWEVRQLLESLALDSPLILHIDDLQWAQPMLLDLIDHVADLSRGAPILLLCTARPELLEDRPAWGGGKLNATALLLEPLATADCEQLLDQLGDGLLPDARARVIAASEGNPLFLEEMVALAHERDTVTIPSTIQALLAARLERLPTEERELLERGAIEGEVFHAAAVGALSDEHQGAKLQQQLAGLMRKELIRPYPSQLQGAQAFRFRHVLIRDAAYDALPKGTRAQLHERFATWLEHNASELAELDEIAGWHLEQAIHYTQELGREFDSTLAGRAAQHLHTAGRRAERRADPTAAMNLLERAHALAPENDTLRAQIGLDLAEQLVEGGDLTRVDTFLQAAEHDSDTAASAALTRLEWMVQTHPQEAFRTIESRLPGLLEQLSQAGDDRGLAKAHWVAAEVHWFGCRATATGNELRAVAEHARKADDRGLLSRALGWYLSTLVDGPENARTIADELKEIEREPLGPFLAAAVDSSRAELEWLLGNLSEARRLAHRVIEEWEVLGMPPGVVGEMERFLGALELSAGNLAAAVASLLRSDAILATRGEQSGRSITQAMLAQAYARLGNADAARAAIALSEELGSAEDVANLIVTHQARARLAVAEGDGSAAERWARSAVEYARTTDFAWLQAGAQLELARTLAALERSEEAASEARLALELYEAKGDRPGAAQALALLDELST